MSGLKNTVKRIINLGKGKGYRTGAERQAQFEARTAASEEAASVEQDRLDAIPKASQFYTGIVPAGSRQRKAPAQPVRPDTLGVRSVLSSRRSLG